MDVYNPFKPLPPLENGQPDIERYLSIEVGFVAAVGYKDRQENLHLRQYVMKFLQIHSKELPEEPEGFKAFTPYLALNYFDNFISRNVLPDIHNLKKGVRKDLDLLATCCLFKAVKTMNPYLSDDRFMGRIRQQFEQRTIAKVARKIKDALGTRIFPVTAFGFLEHFFSKFPFCIYVPGNINELIIQSHADIYLAPLKPSLIAASALLVGAREHLDASEHDVIRNTFIRDFEMKQEQLDLCCAKMKELCDKRQIPIAVVRWDSTRVPGSAQPSSSQVIPGTEVAEASWKEKQKLKGTEAEPLAMQKLKGIEVVDLEARRLQEFGFAINWVGENEKMAFDSILKRVPYSVKRKWRKWHNKKTTVGPQ